MGNCIVKNKKRPSQEQQPMQMQHIPPEQPATVEPVVQPPQPQQGQIRYCQYNNHSLQAIMFKQYCANNCNVCIDCIKRVNESDDYLGKCPMCEGDILVSVCEEDYWKVNH